MLLSGIVPHHVSSAGGYAPPVNGTALALFLAIFFIPAMFAFFAMGAGELYDWCQIRGWRPEHLRKKLK